MYVFLISDYISYLVYFEQYYLKLVVLCTPVYLRWVAFDYFPKNIAFTLGGIHQFLDKNFLQEICNYLAPSAVH